MKMQSELIKFAELKPNNKKVYEITNEKIWINDVMFEEHTISKILIKKYIGNDKKEMVFIELFLGNIRICNWVVKCDLIINYDKSINYFTICEAEDYDC